MVWMPVTCPICGSDKWNHRVECGNCHDRDAEADAIHRAREAFVRDEIDVDELERRLSVALTDPPSPSYSGARLVLR